jgi:hypothetical protein
MSFSKSLLMFVRLAFVVQLVLGICFWVGRLTQYVNVHMIIGSLFVLALWGIAIAGLRTAAKGPAIALVVLGLIIAGFGMSQTTIMMGDMHWIVRVVHLLLAMIAMPLAERLVRASEGGLIAKP